MQGDATILQHPGVGREEFSQNPDALAGVCYRGAFEEYRRALLKSTEACDNYHFGAFATIAGLVIGRRAYLHHGRFVFPNFYTCLIGRTGATRKTTAIRYGQLLGAAVESGFGTLATSSWEGLLDAFGGDTSRRVLMNPGEFRTLAAKAKQDSTSAIIPGMTELYDCPPSIRHKTRGKDVEATRPFLAVLTSSTLEWFRESFDENAVSGGFLNRWIFIDGHPKKPNPFPVPEEPSHWKAAVDALREMDAGFSVYPEDRGHRLTLSTEARDVWADFYTKHLKRKPRSELLEKMGERVQDTALKLALIYACLEGTDEIRSDQLQAAIQFAGWQRDAHARVFEGFGQNVQKRIEDSIIRYLKKDRTRPSTRRELQTSVRIKNASAFDFNRALRALIEADRVIRIDGYLDLSPEEC